MSPGTKGPVIIGVTMMTEVLAAVAIGLRVWSQQIKKRRFFAHDIFIMSGFIFSTALEICIICSVVYGGLGHRAAELVDKPWMLVTFGKLLVVIQIFWCFAMTSVRFSILHLYIHLFSSHYAFRIGCYVLLAMCASWAVGETLSIFLLCRPLSFQWDKLVAGGTCGNLNAAYLSIHIINFFLDTSIALIPIMVLWGLKMPTRRKLGIATMFALGALICTISIARVALYQLALGYDGSDEFTWSGSTLYLFTGIEPHLGCVLACMPLIRPAGEKLASTSLISWARSLGNQSRGSRKSQEGLNQGPTSAEMLRGEPAGKYQDMPLGRVGEIGNDGIRYTVHLDQHSSQGQDVPQYQGWN